MDSKICTKCKVDLDTSNFHNKSKSKDGLDTVCRSCKSKYAARYYKQHQFSIRAQRIEYYHADPATAKARIKMWKAKNKGIIKLRYASRIKAEKTRWRAKHKEERRVKDRAYYQTHKSEFYIRNARRRAMIDHAVSVYGSDITDASWQLFIEKYEYRCAYCGADCKFDIYSKPTMEHIIPIVRGGSHTMINVVPACTVYQGQKLDKTPDEWGRYPLMLHFKG